MVVATAAIHLVSMSLCGNQVCTCSAYGAAVWPLMMHQQIYFLLVALNNVLLSLVILLDAVVPISIVVAVTACLGLCSCDFCVRPT